LLAAGNFHRIVLEQDIVPFDSGFFRRRFRQDMRYDNALASREVRQLVVKDFGHWGEQNSQVGAFFILVSGSSG
jgi:hypothetical protein